MADSATLRKVVLLVLVALTIAAILFSSHNTLRLQNSDPELSKPSGSGENGSSY